MSAPALPAQAAGRPASSWVLAGREHPSPGAGSAGCGYQSSAILHCSAPKPSQKQGYKSHLQELPRVFLNRSFLWILRLAKKQNFHAGRCQHLVCGFHAELRQEAKRVRFLLKRAIPRYLIQIISKHILSVRTLTGNVVPLLTMQIISAHSC